MTKFDYTIRTKTGLNCRHVGQLVIRAKAFVGTTITVTLNGESIRATQAMRLFALEITQGCKVTITADGPWEKEAIADFQRFFEYYL